MTNFYFKPTSLRVSKLFNNASKIHLMALIVLSAIFFTCAISVLAFFTPAIAYALEHNQPEGTQALYRLYNPISSEHLFTTDKNEARSLYENEGWGYEGPAWYGATKSTEGAKPVWRLYNPYLGTHHYTSNKIEAENLCANYSWQYDNNGNPLLYSAGSAGTYKVQRFYNPNLSQHHYTINVAEAKSLPNLDWQAEGVEFTALAECDWTFAGTRLKPAPFDDGWIYDETGTLRYVRGDTFVTGWLVAYPANGSGLERYYIDPDTGKVKTGFFSVDGCNYYAKSDGTVVRGKYRLGDGMLLADNDGKLEGKEGWLVTDKYDGCLQRYRIDKSCDGHMGAHLGFFTIEGKNYYGTDSGYVLRGKQRCGDGVLLANNDGVLESTEGWLVTDQYDGELQRYRIDRSCEGQMGAHVGFFNVDGNNYFSTDTGYVVRNRIVYVQGVWWGANNDGVLNYKGTGGGDTLSNLLGIDYGVFITNMQNLENCDYYLGTPYADWGEDNENPNGDCAGANGAYDEPGVAGMQCTGFVTHALLKQGYANAGAVNSSAWYENARKFYFDSVEDMLNSGVLSKGDIIWSFVYGVRIASSVNHVGFFWGNTSSENLFWHSGSREGVNKITVIEGEVDNPVQWVVIKMV